MQSDASSPSLWHSYAALMRMDKPIGFWLLLWPCWWAITLASDGLPSASLLSLFLIGAIAMRAAGCVINDMADRDFDRQVARTRTRPLASGAITMAHAYGLLAVLLLIALAVALMMPLMVWYLTLPALVLVILYPFMKRITWWPQAFLGLTFNFGALMGWAAVTDALAWPACVLYVAGICWTLGYDTIYAHQDTQDDEKIGLKSLALHLGEHTKQWVSGFYLITVGCFVLLGVHYQFSWLFWLCLLAAAAHFIWQIWYTRLDVPERCMRVFVANQWTGFLLFMAIYSQKWPAFSLI